MLRWSELKKHYFKEHVNFLRLDYNINSSSETNVKEQIVSMSHVISGENNWLVFGHYDQRNVNISSYFEVHLLLIDYGSHQKEFWAIKNGMWWSVTVSHHLLTQLLDKLMKRCC